MLALAAEAIYFALSCLVEQLLAGDAAVAFHNSKVDLGTLKGLLCDLPKVSMATRKCLSTSFAKDGSS